MNPFKISLFILLSFFLIPTSKAQEIQTIDWKFAELPFVSETFGQPRIVETTLGPAVEFDGENDAYFVSVNPLKGMDQLTIEVIFKPDGTGNHAQRFMHLGLIRGERIMFETRVNPDHTWYFDAHTQLNGPGRLTLIDPELVHPTDQWYNVTLVVSGTMQTTYVNGRPQKWGNLNYKSINEGISSFGVRQNMVDFFKGQLYRIRITPRVLLPREFLTDYETLNAAE